MYTRLLLGYGNDSVLCGARHNTESLPYPLIDQVRDYLYG
jgi:hypothetical protein